MDSAAITSLLCEIGCRALESVLDTAVACVLISRGIPSRVVKTGTLRGSEEIRNGTVLAVTFKVRLPKAVHKILTLTFALGTECGAAGRSARGNFDCIS